LKNKSPISFLQWSRGLLNHTDQVTSQKACVTDTFNIVIYARNGVRMNHLVLKPQMGLAHHPLTTNEYAAFVE